MSVQAIGWVLDHSIAEGSERLVLLSLANHAGQSPVDGAWESYPGIQVIQKEARLRRERTVQEVLARLIEGGHVERIVNGAPDERIRGNRRPNLYRILVARGTGFGASEEPKGPDKDPDIRGDAARHPSGPGRDAGSQHPSGDLGVPLDDNQGCRLAPSRGAVSRHLGVPSDGTQTIIEPSVEPSVEPKTPSAAPSGRSLAIVGSVADPGPVEPNSSVPQTTWELFWQRYPRPANEPDARKAWRALIGSGVRDVEILAALDGWVAYWELAATEERYIPHPANWLRKRQWAERTPALQRPANAAGDRKTDQARTVLTNFVAGDAAS